MLNIVATFLDLGDATSRNLKFAHRSNEYISYGEETITESNLMEIRRLHPRLVYLKTFSKRQEAKSGADWEWHIIGHKYTAKMRVQAKRVQCNDKLKIKHKVKSSGRQQRDLLLDTANRDGMKALYCFYCTEPQRTIWKQLNLPEKNIEIQTGCLLADANDVPEATTELKQIECKCIPWHYLFNAPDRGQAAGWDVPSMEDLNGQGRGHGEFDHTGVHETTRGEGERLPMVAEGRNWPEQALYWTSTEISVCRIMLIDVRNVQLRQ